MSAQNPTQLPLQELHGTLERIVFQNEENGYTVARLRTTGHDPEVTITGNLPGINPGERLRLQGFWINHPQYGRQFEAHTFTVEYPATLEGIRKYLGSGLIRGIGPATATKIVDRFGKATLDIIDQEPQRLIEVPGIGDVKVQRITVAWQEQRMVKDIMVFLQSNDVSTGLAVRIYKQYGAESIRVVSSDPYRLARDVYGIGFKTADKIARQIGIPIDHPSRIQAGVIFTLNQFANDGHCFALRDQLMNSAAELLETSREQCGIEINNLIQQAVLIAEDEAVYLPPFHYAEVGVANRLKRMLSGERDRLSGFRRLDWDAMITLLDRQSTIKLTDQQKKAVQMALTEKVSILTGGPGTGKSTITASVIKILRVRNGSVLLCAPTGRAAKRLTETTGLEAKTIHRLLEFKPSGASSFARDNTNPLDADLIIVDETSMIDVLLMNNLLDAVEAGSHLLLVGDVDQLPSVGPGNILRDLIASQAIPVTRLDTIFRQSELSYIIVNAHRINNGEMPVFPKDASDFFLFTEEDPQKAADRVVDLASKRITDKFGFDPLADIQVLAPMHRGSAGVTELNTRLQEELNPSSPGKPELRHGHRVFRVNDRVMQVVNNYDLSVFNGDMGIISNIDLEEQLLTVKIDIRQVVYDYTQLDELIHAYAISIHKAQGSEFPVVIIPILNQHYMMLQRNLIYTAITRARKLVVLVGGKRAIYMAVNNNRIAQRNTRLAERLKTDK
jgi:exodeoxyribonuclease V alpha subunit